MSKGATAGWPSSAKQVRAHQFRNRRRRPAFTLVELTVNMVSAGLLIAGLGSAMMLTLKTLPTDATAGAENNRASRVLSQLADDLQHATNFTEQTASAVTFTVPDRDGDGKVETLRYSWNGTAGQSLKYQYNTNTAVDIATNVQAFNLAKLNRTIAAAYAGPPTNYSVLYEAYSETKVGADNTQITIPVPGGTLDDRLLIAAIVTDGAVAPSIVAPADWNSLGSVVSGSAVGLSLFWKFTSAESGNYTFTWTGAETAYGCVMRFNQVNPVAPFNASATSTQGQSLLSLALPTPAVTTTQDNCMILRLIGVNGNGIATAPLLQTPIRINSSGGATGPVSGGSAYAYQTTAGNAGAASYTWVSLPCPESVSWTIAIAPAPPD
jgi:hypothetical protein